MVKQARLMPEIERERPAALPPLAPPADSASTVLALIERVALDPSADAEKLERMTAMYEALKANEAELAYNAAKGRILKKLASIQILKNRSVLNEVAKAKPQRGIGEAFKYAPLEENRQTSAPASGGREYRSLLLRRTRGRTRVLFYRR